MKQILYYVTTLTLSVLLTSGLTHAQHEVILEQNGANDDFDHTEWTIGGGGFANSDRVNIQKNHPGTYAFSNQNGNKFAQLKVTMKFSQSTTHALDVTVVPTSGANLTVSGISDATGGENVLEINFANTDFIELDELIIATTSQEFVGITYLKIEGVPHEDNNSSGLESESLISWNAIALQNNLKIDSPVDGTIEVYSISGKLISTHKISEGENNIIHNAKGITLLVLKNANKEALGSKKIVL